MTNHSSKNKICSICGIKKPEVDFFYRNRHANKLHAQCKNCYIERRRTMWREHYHRHGSKYRERAVERNRKIKNEIRKQLLLYLSDKACAICGINDPRVLEFDHINPASKTFSIARGITNTFSWEKIMTEIEKCQILCANCHKIKTAEEQGWYKNPVALAEVSDGS